MTGKDVKAQVLADTARALEGIDYSGSSDAYNAILDIRAALSTCVVLTREEAAKVREAIRTALTMGEHGLPTDALALLTPEAGK